MFSPYKPSRQIPHKRILIASDNTTVFGYLNKQGGGERIPPSLAQLGLLQSLKYTHNRHILGCLKVILNITPQGIKVWRILPYYNPWNILLRDRIFWGYLNVILNDPYRRDKSNMYRMILTPFMVPDNVQVWHKSTIGVLCGYAASWPTAIPEIFSYEPDIFRVA